MSWIGVFPLSHGAIKVDALMPSHDKADRVENLSDAQKH